MGLLLVIVVLVLLLGGGGYYGHQSYGASGLGGVILLVVFLAVLFMAFGGGSYFGRYLILLVTSNGHDKDTIGCQPATDRIHSRLMACKYQATTSLRQGSQRGDRLWATIAPGGSANWQLRTRLRTYWPGP